MASSDLDDLVPERMQQVDSPGVIAVVIGDKSLADGQTNFIGDVYLVTTSLPVIQFNYDSSKSWGPFLQV